MERTQETLKVPKPRKLQTNAYYPWAARFWHGMLLSDWVRLLAQNRFRVGLTRLPLATTISIATIFNSLARPLQQWIYGAKIAKTQIKDAPIFIIGHWRSGTTLLHELMVLDERYTFPTTYECFVPNHFLISKWLITKMWFLLPKRRPMDNMITGWDRPQEDEFALCNLGIPSPYATMAFPNNAPQNLEYLDFEGVSPADVGRWKQALLWFLQRVTFRNPQRIILKSPPHLGRIQVLLELFPDARFVHIVRDPYALYSSTIRLWKTLYKFQGLQDPKYDGLEEYVFRCFERMYAAFERQRPFLPDSRLFEIRYEDLIESTLGTMESLYARFQLGGFDRVLPKLREYLEGTRDYQTNRHEIDPELHAEIDRRWGPYMRRYGYCQEAAPAGQSSTAAKPHGNAAS